MLEHAVAIGKPASFGVERTGGASFQVKHRQTVEHVLQFGPVSANILDRGGAYGARNERQVFQAAQALGQGPLYEFVPHFAGSGAHQGVSALLAQHGPFAAVHMQHQTVKIAGEQDIAAATKQQARHRRQLGIGRNLGQFGHRGDAQIRPRARSDTESI